MTCWRACGVASVDFPASAFWIPISLLPAWPSQCILWHASKTVLDVRLYVLGEEVARVTLDGGAISPNQELLKVPGYVGPPHWFPDQEVGARHQTFWVVRRGRQRLFEECEEGMFILSIHLHLVEHVPLELEAIAGPHAVSSGYPNPTRYPVFRSIPDPTRFSFRNHRVAGNPKHRVLPDISGKPEVSGTTRYFGYHP